MQFKVSCINFKCAAKLPSLIDYAAIKIMVAWWITLGHPLWQRKTYKNNAADDTAATIDPAFAVELPV